MNKVLIVGASGATGKLLVADFLERNIEVIAIVRGSSSLKNVYGNHGNYHEVTASISELPDNELLPYITGCDAVLSCLGHNLTWKGIFAKPRRLVTDAIKKISRVIDSLQQDKKVKVVLMNTAGNSNRDIPEKPPLSQRIVVAIIRILIPPHADNEQAADFLRIHVGQQHPFIEWAVVRPDVLIDEPQVSGYTALPSPTRNVIINAGTTSRINVANFMANLVLDTELWSNWKGRMPVIYND